MKHSSQWATNPRLQHLFQHSHSYFLKRWPAHQPTANQNPDLPNHPWLRSAMRKSTHGQSGFFVYLHGFGSKNGFLLFFLWQHSFRWNCRSPRWLATQKLFKVAYLQVKPICQLMPVALKPVVVSSPNFHPIITICWSTRPTTIYPRVGIKAILEDAKCALRIFTYFWNYKEMYHGFLLLIWLSWSLLQVRPLIWYYEEQKIIRRKCGWQQSSTELSWSSQKPTLSFSCTFHLVHS